MLKISFCLLLLSAIIYACGEYTTTMRQIEKLNGSEVESQQKLAEKAKRKETFELPVKPKLVTPPIKLNVQDRKFFEIKGVAPPSDRKVRAGMLGDFKSSKILWAKNVHQKIPIASLSKIMTVLVVLDEIDRREDVTLNTKIKITSRARTTRSSSFLRKHPLAEVSVEECLQSAMIKSANDSCMLLAEFFGNGDPARFAAMMNAKARALKLTKTSFYNPHGLPGKDQTPQVPDNVSTIRDLMFLVAEVYTKRREILTWTRLPSLKLPKNHRRAITINNTNPLISVDGVVGLKTGFTINAGWCLISIYNYSGKTLVGIITGCKSKADRNTFARNLLLWSRKAAKAIK
jgi:D-alanyl-D-alanine carboxypeptidase (penicillin-binding protein 5/6)